MSKEFALTQQLNQTIKETSYNVPDYSSSKIMPFSLIFLHSKPESEFEFKSRITDVRSDQELKLEYDYFIASLQREIKNLQKFEQLYLEFQDKALKLQEQVRILENQNQRLSSNNDYEKLYKQLVKEIEENKDEKIQLYDHLENTQTVDICTIEKTKEKTNFEHKLNVLQ